MSKPKTARQMRGNRTLLTVADIRALEAEIADDIKARSELDAKILRKTERLTAAKLFLPDEPLPATKKTKSTRKARPMPKAEVVAPAKTRGPTKTRGTWRTDVVKILSAQQTGIAYPDLLAQVVNLRPDRPRSQGDKGFYHAIRRLILAEQIVKASNGLLYSAKLLKAMSDRGEALPTTRSVGRGGSASIVLGILNTAPDGLSGPALMERAAKHPDAPASLRTYRHYIYNILAKLRMNGAITKDGNTYRLASRGQAVH